MTDELLDELKNSGDIKNYSYEAIYLDYKDENGEKYQRDELIIEFNSGKRITILSCGIVFKSHSHIIID
jgi:hypothetical protein